jgi:nitrate reductase NapAB chaperone NapD
LGWITECVYDVLDEDTGELIMFMVLADDLEEAVQIMTKASTINDIEDVKDFFLQFSSGDEKDEISSDKNDAEEDKK